MRKPLFSFAVCFILVTSCGGTHGARDPARHPVNTEDGGCPAPPDATAAAPAATARFMEPCRTDADCMTGLCFNFNAKGPRCTAACTSPCQCKAPSSGCNNMGVCKAP